MKILDALLNRPIQRGSANPSSFQDLATVGQPVPVAMIIQPPSQLSSGSSLNKAATGAWPSLIDANYKFKYGWRPSWRVQPHVKILPGNYAGADSVPNWGFRFTEFFGIGSYPVEGFRSPYRPEYNILTPIQWNQMVENENVVPTGTYTRQSGNESVNQTSTFVPTGTASLKGSGQALL